VHHNAHARAVAAACAAAIPDALGIVLIGSVAAGTDHPHSDIDLLVATDTGHGTQVLHRDGRMVTLTRKTPADLEAALTRPWEAVTAVAPWRRAHLLHDPDHRMRALQATAAAWTWDAIPDAATWAAGELVGLAEEVHKIHGMLTQGRARAAAANRLITALALPTPMAAADRILVESENDLWDAVAAAEGPHWARSWDLAAGVTAAGHETGCRAALDLYRHAAAKLTTHLDGEARTIVATAASL
jgi:predicted nucleotidyltransferase